MLMSLHATRINYTTWIFWTSLIMVFLISSSEARRKSGKGVYNVFFLQKAIDHSTALSEVVGLAAGSLNMGLRDFRVWRLKGALNRDNSRQRIRVLGAFISPCESTHILSQLC